MAISDMSPAAVGQLPADQLVNTVMNAVIDVTKQHLVPNARETLWDNTLVAQTFALRGNPSKIVHVIVQVTDA